MATPQFIAREEGGLSHSSPGQEARGVSYREVQLGSQARSSSEVRACRCELVLRHWRPPPEPRVGRGSALPRRERGCLSGPWLPVPLCSPQMRMPVTQHPWTHHSCFATLSPTCFLQDNLAVFFSLWCMYCITAASLLLASSQEFAVSVSSVCSVPDPGGTGLFRVWGNVLGVALPYGARMHAEVECGPQASCVLSAASVN